ncbi:G-protein coupled bile acid receptor 1-like [Paramormyrops kingsleyae]|uniref:G-protein coupled bile acid receptor 1-like n=1 Tax=Paramormyrops kingsleyae TaxID=1676925 RepID=UPI000CD5D578|nr:G-protein coupled bile acid receptor 1-like [Paramormyrops kingsleyae]
MARNDSLLAEERLIFYITIPLSSAIVLANLFIFLGIAYNRQLHSTPNYFFLSLLVADLCTGVALPLIPWMGINRDLDFSSCLLVHIFPNFLFLSFLFNLVMVHYERYVCIVSPLHYSRFWVHRSFPAALLVAWAPPLLFASLPAFGWNNRGAGCGHNSTAVGVCSAKGVEGCSYRRVFPNSFIYLEVYGVLLPAILSIVGMTCRVLWIAREQLRGICKLHRAVERAGSSGEEHRLNLRYARCVALISLTFLACWVPYIAYLHVSVGIIQHGGVQGRATTHIVLSCTGIGSTAIFPVILGLANRQYTDSARRAIRDLWDRCRATSNIEEIEL